MRKMVGVRTGRLEFEDGVDADVGLDRQEGGC